MISAAAVLMWGLVSSEALAQTPGGMAPAAMAPGVAGQAVAAPAAAVDATPNPDPWEPFNRKVYAVFQGADRVAIRPAAIFYSRATPKPVQLGLRNAFRNLHEPIVLVNDVFQANFQGAGVTLGRLTINSTIGVAGLFDPATSAGLAYHNNGFGNTLGRYGVPPGPYLFAAGPTDVRDAIGGGVDVLTDPFTWINFDGRLGFGVGRGLVSALDDRAQADPQLKALAAMSTDEYASLRSLYLQNRAAEITGGQVNINDLPSFGDEPSGSPDKAGTPGAPPAAPPPTQAATPPNP